MEISKETYGLILISDNCYKILEDDINKGLKNKLEQKYVFSWDKIPGKDNARLIEFLTKKFGIDDWAKTAKIEKIDNGNTIKVSTKKRSLSLKLNDTESEVSLEIDDAGTKKFIAKMENNKINIYDEQIYDGQNNFINFWTLFGVHDTAILVRSPGRLDQAVNVIGDWIAELNEKGTPIKRHEILNDLDSSIDDRCNKIADLYIKRKIDKNFKIFEYRVDPLIPIYVNYDTIRSNEGVFLIMYIKFDLSSVNEMLNKEKKGKKNIQDFYLPFMNADIAAIFQGLGLFDVIIIARKWNYKDIRNEIIEIRNKSEFPISETYSLISENISLKDLGFTSLNCSMLVKVRAGAESHEIWEEIKNIAIAVGLNGLCIRKATYAKHEPVSCPPYTSFRAGCFDLAIDLRFKKVADLQNFINILDSMPFIEDTSTSISYDTDLPIGCDDTYVPYVI